MLGWFDGIYIWYYYLIFNQYFYDIIIEDLMNILFNSIIVLLQLILRINK